MAPRLFFAVIVLLFSAGTAVSVSAELDPFQAWMKFNKTLLEARRAHYLDELAALRTLRPRDYRNKLPHPGPDDPLLQNSEELRFRLSQVESTWPDYHYCVAPARKLAREFAGTVNAGGVPLYFARGREELGPNLLERRLAGLTLVFLADEDDRIRSVLTSYLHSYQPPICLPISYAKPEVIRSVLSEVIRELLSKAVDRGGAMTLMRSAKLVAFVGEEETIILLREVEEKLRGRRTSRSFYAKPSEQIASWIGNLEARLEMNDKQQRDWIQEELEFFRALGAGPINSQCVVDDTIYRIAHAIDRWGIHFTSEFLIAKLKIPERLSPGRNAPLLAATMFTMHPDVRAVDALKEVAYDHGNTPDMALDALWAIGIRHSEARRALEDLLAPVHVGHPNQQGINSAVCNKLSLCGDRRTIRFFEERIEDEAYSPQERKRFSSAILQIRHRLDSDENSSSDKQQPSLP